MKTHVVRFVVPFAISGALLIVLLRDLAPHGSELLAALGSADWRLVVPAVALYFVGALLRSARWHLLLPQQAVSTPMLFRALLVGLTVNNLLPLRMGEVARAYLLSRWARVPYGATIASLVVERILDGLTLAVLLLLALVLVPTPPAYLLSAGILAATAFLVGAVVLALAAWRPATMTATAAWVARRLPPRVGGILLGMATSFARSLGLVHRTSRFIQVLGLSLLAWCSELGLFFVLMFSFGLPAAYPLALLVGSAANFATLLPSSPGYLGTFDKALVNVLQDATGTSAGLAGAYALVVHAALFLPVVLVGTLVLWRSHMTFTQITHAPDRTRPAEGSWPAAAA